MKDLKGTKTLENLKAAYAGESQARNKYDYYASQAKKDGYVQIQNIFKETEGNEREHAKLWFNYAFGVSDTQSNLLDAAAGEHYEYTEMYKDMAATAREEGFDEIAAQMEGVATVEKTHYERYKKLAANIRDSEVFVKKGENVWQCINCGYLYVGTTAPEICPVCKHPRAYFQLRQENY